MDLAGYRDSRSKDRSTDPKSSKQNYHYTRQGKEVNQRSTVSFFIIIIIIKSYTKYKKTE